MGTPSTQIFELFTVDHDSATPPFRQLQNGVIQAISDGALLPGQQLPTVRALAARLGLATNTVASAYRALEAAGILIGEGRAGTFVSLGDDPVETAARRIAADACRELVKLDISPKHAQRLLEESLAVAFDGA